MKTIEEKDDAVLAELDRMRAERRSIFVVAGIPAEWPSWEITKYREDFFAIRRGDSDFLEYVGRTSPDGFSEQVTNEFYRLLGIESAELEARNAALVKALGYLQKSVDDKRIQDDTIRMIAEDVCKQCLEANGKEQNG